MSPARGNDPFASLPVDEPDVPRRNSAKAARDNSGMLVLIVLVMVSCGVGGGLLYYHHFSQRAAIESKAGLSREEYERLANHVADAEETIKRFEKLRREEAMLDEQLYNKLSKKISDMRLDLLRSKDKMAELKSTPGF